MAKINLVVIEEGVAVKKFRAGPSEIAAVRRELERWELATYGEPVYTLPELQEMARHAAQGLVGLLNKRAEAVADHRFNIHGHDYEG